MKQLRLQSVVIKKFKPGQAIKDHINRKNLVRSEPTEKNKVWATDITYVSTQHVWAYLSKIMDRYTKKVIAWDLVKRMTVELVQSTLIKELESQNYPEAVILHSDQGSQYTSHEYEGTKKFWTHSLLQS